MRRALPVLLCAALMGVGGARQAAAKPGTDLLSAYKKEFAFLEAEKNALQKRLTALRDQARTRLARAQGEVNSLQTRLLQMRTRAESVELALREAGQLAAGGEQDDRVVETIDRAAESLKQVGIKLNASARSQDDRLAALQTIFGAAGELMQRNTGIRTEQGSFFLENGTKVKGKLVHIGAVATYGVSAQGSGALAPAGEDRLKIWNEDASTSARAVAAGQRPAMVDIFLYESLKKEIKPRAEKTALIIVQSGGGIAWVIVGLGLLALLLVLVRAVTLWRASSDVSGLLRTIQRPILQRNYDEARELCRRARGAAAHILVTVIPHLHKERQKLEDIISEAVLREVPRIERFGAIITVFAAVAPLLGLLGTVTGMISTFDIITEHGTGDPKLLSGGISEALVTTELGLIVAIPALLLGALMNSRAQGVEAGMERAAMRVVNLVHGDVPPDSEDDGMEGTPVLAEEAS